MTSVSPFLPRYLLEDGDNMTDVDETRPIADDGRPDVVAYNEELERLGSASWFGTEWLFAECYLYRLVSLSCLQT